MADFLTRIRKRWLNDLSRGDTEFCGLRVHNQGNSWKMPMQIEQNFVLGKTFRLGGVLGGD